MANPSLLMLLYLSSLKNADSLSERNETAGSAITKEDRLAKAAMDSGMLLSMYLSSLDQARHAAPQVNDLDELLPEAGRVPESPDLLGKRRRKHKHHYGPGTQCCTSLALHSTGSLAHSKQRGVIGTYSFVGLAHDNLPIYKHSTSHYWLFYNDSTKHWQVSAKLYQNVAFLITYGSIWCPEQNTWGWQWYDQHYSRWVLDKTARFYCLA